ncbi:MAG: amino acid ABC transporter permease [Candidatus Atribacteria bacterium]|nr:amino acid ABC transporter permease [Candidatus Atribacteria bacterium]
MIEFSFVKNILMPPLLEGTIATLKLIGVFIPISLIIGVLAAVARVYGNKFISWLSIIYVIYFRGTPLIVQLFIIYLGLPYIGIILSPFESAVIAMSLCSGAYQSEYIRGSLQSIKNGQMMAAESLGMTRVQAILYIILPQALRRAIPAISNNITYSVKSSSLAMMVTYVELTGEGKIIAAVHFRYIEVFMIVGIIYLVLVSVLTKLLSILENKLKIPGLE